MDEVTIFPYIATVEYLFPYSQCLQFSSLPVDLSISLLEFCVLLLEVVILLLKLSILSFHLCLQPFSLRLTTIRMYGAIIPYSGKFSRGPNFEEGQSSKILWSNFRGWLFQNCSTHNLWLTLPLTMEGHVDQEA